MKNSFILIAFFILGITVGIYQLLPPVFTETDYSVYALYMLVFLVGMGVGADKKMGHLLKVAKLKIILIPLTTVIGTSLGVAIISVFINSISVREALAIGAGFGWYSLSSILISKISGESLGIIALMANILRELITLFTAPLLVKYFGKIAPIVSGGATSMDTTLPVVVQFSGKEYAVVAIFHGIVLTILVPFLVTFILKF